MPVAAHLRDDGDAFRTTSLDIENHHFAFSSPGGYLHVLFGKPFQVEVDGIVYSSLDFFARVPCSNATGQVGDISAVAGPCPLIHYHVLPHTSPFISFSSAFFIMLFNVPGDISSDRVWQETVTKPFLVGCLNCLWLPFCLTWYHPSSFDIRIISRIFMSR